MKTTKQIRGFCLVLVFLALSACNKTQVVNPTPLGSPGTVVPPIQEEYRINVGDKLSIKLFYNPELNQDVVVRPDGRITLQLVNEIKAAGMAPAKLSEQLTEKYAKYLAQPPEVSVIVDTFTGNRVFVGGEVGAPGAKDLIGPTTVLGAIMMGGGFKDTGDRSHVILVRKDEDNKPLYLCLDMEKATKGIDPAQDVYVKAYDMVVVPRSGIADVDLWVSQYIGQIISPFSMFGYYFVPTGGIIH